MSMTKLCLNCDKEYEADRSNRKFCSRSCSAQLNNKKYPKRTDSVTICPVCGGQKARKNITCSHECSRKEMHDRYIARWLDGKEDGVSGKEGTSRHIRAWLHEQRGSECWDCGWSKTNPTTGRVPVQIEHVDGDWKNNRPENLKLLCPNCHSLTPTYGALNKGNGRKDRYN